MPLVFTFVWATAGACIGVVTQSLVRHREADRLPLRPSAVPIATACLFALLGWRIGQTLALLTPSWLAAIGVPLAAIDLRDHRLPNWLVLPSYPAIIGLVALDAAVNHASVDLVRALAGMIILLAFYAVLYGIFGGQLGGGDVKLAGLVGGVLGQVGWGALATGTVLAWFLAAIALPVLRAVRPTAARSGLPFGPFLVAGTIVTVLTMPVMPIG